MRAREFIAEGQRRSRRAEARHDFERAHPGLIGPESKTDTYWGRYYDHYRVAVLAGMDLEELEDADDINFFGNVPIFSAYTDHDRKKLLAIMKKLDMHPGDKIGNGSHETDDTNTVSPVKSFRGYAR